MENSRSEDVQESSRNQDSKEHTKINIDAAIQRAINGDYTLNFRQTLRESWQKTVGVKRFLLGAWLLLGICIVLVMEVASYLGFGAGALLPANGALPPMQTLLMRAVVEMLATALVIPFIGGFIMMAINRIQNKAISFGTLFRYTEKSLPLFISTILMTIMTLMGFLLFIIPGIYLCVGYMCTMALILDKGMGPWEAMEASRKAVGKRWFTVAGLLATMTLIFFLSIIPMGIGLIWSLPMMIILFNVIYKNIFGISS